MSDIDHKVDKLLLKACIDSPNDMIILAIDKEYNYLVFNAFHERIMRAAYGIEVKQGMNLIKCMTNDDDIQKAKLNYGRAFDGVSHITIEEYGEFDRHYYETRYNPIYNENNAIIGATAFSYDVTDRIHPSDRKQMENALIQSETRFRELIELAPDGILLGSAQGIIIGANSKMLKISGRKLNELIGLNIEILFSPDELSRVPLRYDLLLKGKVVKNERILLRPDGVSVPIEMHTRMMPDGTYQSILQDNTERIKFENNLKEKERFLRESQSVARLGTFVWEMSDGIWRSSKILDEIFGIDDKYNRTLEGWGDLIHPDWREIMIEYVARDVLGKLQKFDKEYQIIRQSDKQVRWVHGLAELELDANQNPVRLIGTISDITDRKIAEEKLKEQSEALKRELESRRKAEKILQKSHKELEISRRASLNLLEDIRVEMEQRKKAEEEVRKINLVLEQRVAERTAQLESANKELEAFAYSVSHDLRAPLRAIDGFSKFLIEDLGTKLDPEGARMLGLIRGNTQKMDQLIIDILALSRVSRNDLKKSKVDMVKMALSMLNEVASPEIQKKINIIVGKMPEAYADSTYLKQVWINLISNAIKFSSKRPDPEIEFGGFTKGEFHIYYVHDNGVGFKPEYAHKLFNVFRRLHKVDEFEGNGVGLAIVQRIINRHNGNVWAEGKVDEGATFYFSLPIIN